MQNIHSIAHRIKSDIIAQALLVGGTPQEIAVLEESDFFEDAEAEIRSELAGLRIHNRLAVRAARPRQPAKRPALRRTARQKAATASGTNDGDGPRWSYETIDHFFSGLMPICRIDKATGQKGISVVKLFSSVNSISMSDAACFLSHYLSNYIAASGVLEFEEAIELFRASNVVLKNHMA